MATVLDVLVQQSPQLQELGKQLDRELSPGIRALQELGKQASPALKAAALAAERLANSPALKAAKKAARQFHESPDMKAAALAAERLANSPALKAAVLAAGKLARMPPLPLTPELFSKEACDNERLQAAVRRLERADDVIAQAPEAERAVEELAADATTVIDAARPEAQEGVNAWTRLLWFWLLEKLLVDPALEAARETVLPMIVVLLVVVTGPPDPLAGAGLVDDPGARAGGPRP